MMVRSVLLRSVLPPVAALAVLLALWEGTVRVLGIPAFLLPPPSAVFASGVHDARELAASAWVTAKAALMGFGLSALAGALAAVVLSSSRLLERALYPYTIFLQTDTIAILLTILCQQNKRCCIGGLRRKCQVEKDKRVGVKSVAC